MALGSTYCRSSGFVRVPGTKRPGKAWHPTVEAKTRAGFWPYCRAATTRISSGAKVAKKAAPRRMRSSVCLMSRTYRPSVRTL